MKAWHSESICWLIFADLTGFEQIGQSTIGNYGLAGEDWKKIIEIMSRTLATSPTVILLFIGADATEWEAVKSHEVWS